MKKIDKKNINYQKLSELTSGLTGADIANICNQSKINAIQEKSDYITYSHLEKAIDEIMIGREKPERKMSREELVRVSLHEAGHALLGYMLESSEPPIKVSILPRGENALGFSQPKPSDLKLYTDNHVLSQICVLLGGRGAEKLFYDGFSSGAHDDIERATNLAYKYMFEWGMDAELGPVNFSTLYKNIPINFIELLKSLIKKLENFAQKTLVRNKNYLEKISEILLQKETINYDDIIDILPNELKNSIKNRDIIEYLSKN